MNIIMCELCVNVIISMNIVVHVNCVKEHNYKHKCSYTCELSVNVVVRVKYSCACEI